MVDYSKAEISAIKQVFPESQISICDFHRLQTWQRWLRIKENNIADPDEALRLIKHVASASNQHDFDKAVEVLVDSEYWKNERFRSYFEEVRLSVKELWVMSYRLEFDVVLTTNNGIEAQNRVLEGTVRGLLQATFRKLAESVPQSSGLHIRGSPTKGCSPLKLLSKRRRL
ncbi:hypothetical protein MRX96_028992 [Rhipicephalus microplus]